MKPIIVVSLFVLISTCSFAQMSINSGSSSASSKGMSLSYSIGQVFLSPQPTVAKANNAQAENLTKYSRQRSVLKARVFPNPAQDYVQLELIGGDEELFLSVTDLMGKDFSNKIQWRESRTNEIRNYQIDIFDLPTGYYVVSVSNAKGRKYGSGFKFLKQ